MPDFDPLMKTPSPARKKTASSKAASPAQPPALVELPSQQAWQRTLPNGLDILVQEDHSNPLACVQLWVRAGSVHEEGWTGAGLAHLVEHMLFKGTEQRTAPQISQAIQARGGYVNAFTSFNRTVYWIDGLSEQVDAYLDVLADMARRSRFDADDLAREMDVIRREMSMYDDDPSSVVQELLQATAFRRHPLKHPIIGYREVFDQVGREDVVRFVRRQYAPNNCFVIVTGDVDAEAVFALVEKHFGTWERRPYQPILLPDEPPQPGLRENVKGFNTELTRLAQGWQIPGDAHPRKAALDILALLLGTGRSSRLYQELRERRGVAHSVWAGAWTTAECGLFAIEAECDPQDEAKAREGMDAVLRAMRETGPTHEELDKAMRSTLASQLRSLLTTRGQAMSLGQGWITFGVLDYGRRYLEQVKALSPGDILQAAREHLDLERRSIAIVEPRAAPSRRAPAPRAKSGRTLERIVLPGGLTLIVGENPRLPLVSMRAQFLAGVPVETDLTAGATQVTAQMLLKGTKTRGAEEIAAALESRGGSVQAAGDVHRLVASAELMRGDEALALDLLSDILQNATLPESALEQVRKRQIASIREEMEDPLTIALRRCRREIFAGQPYARTALGTEESITGMTTGHCRQIGAHLAAANGVISIFGDVRAGAIREQAAAAFATLPHGVRCPSATLDFPASGAPGEWEMRLDKEQAVLVVGFRTPGLRSAGTHALTLIDEACSDMGSRLFNRLREELGLAYYVGAQAFNALGAGAFYFYIGTEPGKIDLAQKEMLAQIADLASNGLTPDELARARTSWRSGWLRAQQGNAALAESTGWDELNGLGHRHFEELPQIMEAVSAADIQRVAAASFQPRSAFVVRVLPE